MKFHPKQMFRCKDVLVLLLVGSGQPHACVRCCLKYFHVLVVVVVDDHNKE